MDSIQDHINQDKKILDDPMICSQTRRHIKSELDQLEKYQENHPEDNHDPTPLELYCDSNPGAIECRIYED